MILFCRTSDVLFITCHKICQCLGTPIRGCLSSGIDGVSEVNMVAALRLAELTEFIDDRGSLINVPLQENAANLSGGQKQRLNLARSFLSKSQFIILDEPTSNLDFKHSKNIFKNIKKYNPGK